MLTKKTNTFRFKSDTILLFPGRIDKLIKVFSKILEIGIWVAQIEEDGLCKVLQLKEIDSLEHRQHVI